MITKLKQLTKSQKIILSIIFVFIVVLTTVLSFAYLAPIIGEGSNTPLDITGAGIESLNFEKGSDISIVATPENFDTVGENLSGSTWLTATALANKSGDPYVTSYNVFLNIGTNEYEYTSGTTPELLLTITGPDGEITNLTGLTHTTVNGVSGFDITTKTGVINIVEDYAITSPNHNTPITDEWEFTITFLAHSFSQNANQGKTLIANLEVTQNEVTEFTLSSTCLNSKMGECFGKNNHMDATLLQHTSDLENGAGDDNFRYSGKNDVVNNYVCFGSDITPCPEENKYRIIGIFDGSVKLIKNTSSSNLQWTSVSGGEYSTSNIQLYLNDTFYNSISSEYQSMIKTSTWHLSGNDSAAETPYKFYSDVILNPIENDTITDKIGLMYVSDYGYAVSSNLWTSNVNSFNSPAIKPHNWLYNSSEGVAEWTISDHSNYVNDVWFIHANGYISNAKKSGYQYVRPTFYLNSLVTLAGGTGTSSDPYTLGYTPIVSEYLIENQDETNGLLQHTSGLENGANDNNYRYAGSNTVVSNNWVCFGSNEVTCPEENKYRIIGIYDGNAKLIKSTSVSNIVWDATPSNDYETSDIKIHLNNDFYNTIPLTYQKLIKESTWYVGGSHDTVFKTSYEFYRDAIVSPVTNKTSEGKIGLMYISDYGYAAHQEAWLTDLRSYNNQTIKENNWLFNLDPDQYEWFVESFSNNSYEVSVLHHEGFLDAAAAIYDMFGYRPSFYLESNVKILSGVGSETDPFHVGM